MVEVDQALERELPEVNQALKSDLAGIQRLDEEVYKEDAYSYFTLRQHLDTVGELFQVHREESTGDVIGYGFIGPDVRPGIGWLHSLVVSPPHRRKRIGTAIAVRLLYIAANLYSLEKIYLTVAPGNRAAISLYERLGFAAPKAGCDYDYVHDYYGPNEDRIVMCRPSVLSTPAGVSSGQEARIQR